MYRENIHFHACTDSYKKTPSCKQYKSKEALIYLRVIQDTSYIPGDQIIGNLDFYGWIAVRSINIKEATYAVIDGIGKKRRW